MGNLKLDKVNLIFENENLVTSKTECVPESEKVDYASIEIVIFSSLT